MTDEPPRPDFSHPDATADVDRQRIQWLHERSGEVELLISGALLFGLIQVPGRLAGWWDGVFGSLDDSTFILLFLLYFYVRVMVFTMIAAFSLHLVTRAYWVGLVGLDSVFPEGVDWNQVRYGPVAKQVYRERLPTLPFLARRADDVGSAIFSVAFWIVTIFIFSIVFGLVFGAISWVLSTFVLTGVETTTILVAFALLVGTVPLASIGVERLLGDNLDPKGATAGYIRKLLTGYYLASGAALYLPIQFTLFSRIPKRVVWPAAILIFVALFSGLLVTETGRTGGRAYSPTELLPDRPGARSVGTDHFADTRAANATVPYIQSDIVEGPYVRLTIPLVALAYVDRLTAACPDLEPLGDAGFVESSASDAPPDREREAQLLSCFGQVWTVHLDGAVRPLEWDFVWTGGRGPRAIVAYLPTSELGEGAHELLIERAPSPESQDAEEPRIARYFIRFRI